MRPRAAPLPFQVVQLAEDVAHVAGEALCILSVRGDLDLVGLKRGSDYSFSGRGGVKGKVGVCPFCIKFSKSVGVLYKNDEWDVDY